MFRENFYDLLMVQTHLPPKQVIRLAESFTQFGRYTLSTEDRDDIFKTRILASTPMSKIFERLVHDGVEKHFTLFSLKGADEDIPEQLTYRHMCYDTLQMENAIPKVFALLKVFPDLNKKLLMNVTSLISQTPSGPVLRDSSAFQSLVVRDVLCRSFYQGGGRSNWISPAVDMEIAKIYGQLISTQLSRFLSLRPDTEKLIYTTFLMFMLGQMGHSDMVPSTLSVKARFFYYSGNSHDVDALVAEVQRLCGKSCPESLDDTMTAINNLGIPRLHLTRQLLGQRFKSISVDIPSATISIEYPPYFLWACLIASSGMKTGLSGFLKTLRLHKDVLLMCHEIAKSQALDLLEFTL